MGMGAKKIRRAFYGYVYFARPLISLRMFMGRHDIMIFDVLTAIWHINDCLFGVYLWIECMGNWVMGKTKTNLFLLKNCTLP